MSEANMFTFSGGSASITGGHATDAALQVCNACSIGVSGGQQNLGGDLTPNAIGGITRPGALER